MSAVSLRTILGAAILSIVFVVVAPLSAAPPSDRYKVTPLVSDQAGMAPTLDPNLRNGWGLARSTTTSPWWVADNGLDRTTLYSSAGAITPLVPTVEGRPTGADFAGIAGNFNVATTASTTLAPASFVFSTEDGQIRAWRGGSAAALVTADLDDGAIYKGLAITPPSSAAPMIYAADFHNARVDVFDGAWHLVTPPGAFVDTTLPDHYAPFGIQTIGSRVFVAYARQDEEREDETAGRGRGFVDAFDLQGTFLGRVAQRGQLNAPWGLAMAPASFGRFGGDLLVGNFGDGQINAFEEMNDGTFHHRGTLEDQATGEKLAIDGLWALEFGNAGSNGTPDQLFFTAGPDDENHGLFGMITSD